VSEQPLANLHLFVYSFIYFCFTVAHCERERDRERERRTGGEIFNLSMSHAVFIVRRMPKTVSHLTLMAPINCNKYNNDNNYKNNLHSSSSSSSSCVNATNRNAHHTRRMRYLTQFASSL